jgi:hypothetical protein
VNKITEAIVEVQQAQQTLLINLQTFLRSGGREAAARLDAAIEEERRTLDRICGDRRDFLAKP